MKDLGNPLHPNIEKSSQLIINSELIALFHVMESINDNAHTSIEAACDHCYCRRLNVFFICSSSRIVLSSEPLLLLILGQHIVGVHPYGQALHVPAVRHGHGQHQ